MSGKHFFWFVVAMLTMLAAQSQPDFSEVNVEKNVERFGVEPPRPAAIMPLAPCTLITDIAVGSGSAAKAVIAVGTRGHVFLKKPSSGLPQSAPTCESAAYWQQQPSPVSVLLNTISMEGSSAWAAGHDGVILHSADAGKSWQVQYRMVDDEFPVTFLDSLFLNDQRGFIVGAYSAFAQTSDGGKNWIYRILDKEIEGHLHAITRLGDGTLLVAGADGIIYTSADDGLNWQWDDEFPYEGSMFTVVPLGEKGVLVAGLRGHVFIKRDWQQDEWQPLKPANENTLFTAALQPSGEVLLGGTNGQLLTTTDNVTVLKALPAETSGTVTSLLSLESARLIAGEYGIKLLP